MAQSSLDMLSDLQVREGVCDGQPCYEIYVMVGPVNKEDVKCDPPGLICVLLHYNPAHRRTGATLVLMLPMWRAPPLWQCTEKFSDLCQWKRMLSIKGLLAFAE